MAPDKVPMSCSEPAAVVCGTAWACLVCNKDTFIGDAETVAEESCTSNKVEMLFPETAENRVIVEVICSKHCHPDSCCFDS